MEIFLDLLLGFWQNIILFIVTLAGAIPLGFLVMLCVRSKFKPLSLLFKLIVWVIRGTPLMLQLITVFYLPSVLFGTALPRMTAAMVAFIINYACYFSEIYRGGIESIPKGQYEACSVLGMTRMQTFFKVILMQVVKRIVAPMGNEVITLVKDTSLANSIAVAEIIMTSRRYLTEGNLLPFFSTAVFFLLFVGLLTILISKVEKRFSYYST